jgi:ADP-ribosylglycohydrolase
VNAAHIRCDLYGMVSPGAIEDAAALAWHDAAAYASESGLYGAMWQAACVAAAHAGLQGEKLVKAGLGQIPAECRFATAIRDTVAAWRAHPDDHDATVEDIERRTGHRHCIHAIPNACLIAAAVLHGRGDVGRTICLAVQGGLDTDCNGANAGAIVGAGVGLEAIPERWYACFNDRIETDLRGCPSYSIAALADEMIAVWKKAS